MFKKNWSYILVLIFAVIALCLIKLKNPSSINDKNKFAIEDTSLITKIFLADRNGNTITLNRNMKNWIVNDQFIAREDAINTLLSTSKKIRIKKPVSKAAF